LQRKWQSTPLAKVFSLRSEFHLLQQRGLITRMRLGIKVRGATYYEAFQGRCTGALLYARVPSRLHFLRKLTHVPRILITGFDSANNGVISPSELFAALDYLGVQATVDDVIDIMRTCDADSDQNLSWGEFVEMLRWNDEAMERFDPPCYVDSSCDRARWHAP
jgi:hypothetical protein